MTDDPPAPEPGASLVNDERAVSTTLGYTLTLSITAVLLAGLLTAGGTLIEDQRQAVATDELTVTGQQLAGGLEDADRLASTNQNGTGEYGTVRVNVWLPDGVGMGGYTLRVVNQSSDANQPARATIVATADGTDARRNVSFRTQFPVANRTVPGGPVTIDVRHVDDDGVPELVVEESMDLAPEAAMGAAEVGGGDAGAVRTGGEP